MPAPGRHCRRKGVWAAAIRPQLAPVWITFGPRSPANREGARAADIAAAAGRLGEVVFVSLMFALDEKNADELAAGTRLLGGLYQIEEPLQQGGFALTYVARDSLDRHVVIKECFPSEIVERREGRVLPRSAELEAQFLAVKAQFLREARGVAALKHPDVVAVHQVFEENNTAYMALDYVAGMDLISVLEDEPERLSGAFIEKTLIGTLKALRHIHSNGILHRDIAPDNIRVDGADRITLIDFGAAGARGSRSGAADGSVPSVKDGYSPPEFYTAGETQDISSDLYALGATFHHLVTGQVPPSGPSRRAALEAGAPDPYTPLAAGAWDCGHHVLVTIDMALMLAREARPQSADVWLDALERLPKAKPAPLPASVLTPRLNAAIGDMVREVNSSLSQPGAEPAPGRAAIRLTAGPARASEAQVRRINPGYDLLARPLLDEALAPPVAERAAPSPAPPGPPARRSFFSALFTRYLAKGQEALPS